ncbi:MAG: DUF2948 family protein [Hyphomicrobiales bacterium]|nr:DUF2948 family protein [Hyphomicrobiales bacterium]MCY4048285.1 DUF2948 family protein [Hyphomicrobiales bacterium]MCY4053834.1 DUF2948 family protein [Hyphomicrobiales bacterium]
MNKPLKLRGNDSEDVAIIASCLQESVGKIGNMIYQPKRRSFYCLLNRFAWERRNETDEGAVENVGCLLYFHCVLGAHRRKLDKLERDDSLCLLTLYFHESVPPGGMVRMLFANEGEICLDVEALDVYLLDVGRPWSSIVKPDDALLNMEAWQS